MSKSQRVCFVFSFRIIYFFCSGEEIYVTTHKVSTKTRHSYSHTQAHSLGDCSLQKSAKNSTYSHKMLRLFQVFYFSGNPLIGAKVHVLSLSRVFVEQNTNWREKNTVNLGMIVFQTQIDELSFTQIFTRRIVRSGWIIGAIGTRVYTSNLLHSIFSTKLNASSTKSQ